MKCLICKQGETRPQRATVPLQRNERRSSSRTSQLTSVKIVENTTFQKRLPDASWNGQSVPCKVAQRWKSSASPHRQTLTHSSLLILTGSN